MRRLFLHIGHGKTGSSFMQSAFARSADALCAAGISYPLPRNYKAALEGRITSGNIREFFAHPGTDGDLFFSSEALFQYFSDRRKQQEITDRLSKIGADRLLVLLFIRDPVDHCCSAYQQSVKKQSNSAPLSRQFELYNVPRRVHEALRFCRELGAEVTVHNYSDKNSSIIDLVSNWLGVSSEIFSTPPVDVVNRSMTRSEIALLRSINKHHDGPSGHILADALCNECPHIKADDMRPAIEDQQALWDRLKEWIEVVNNEVPSFALYRKERDIRPTRDNVSDGFFTFTAEQLDVIGEKLAAIERDR